MNINHIPHEFHESHLAGDQVPLAARIQRCPEGHLFDYGSRVGSLTLKGAMGGSSWPPLGMIIDSSESPT